MKFVRDSLLAAAVLLSTFMGADASFISMPPFNPSLSTITLGGYRIGCGAEGFVCDDFTRPNTSLGTVSNTPTGSVYNVQSTGSPGAVFIKNNELTTDASQQATYVSLTLPNTVNSFGGVIGFNSGGGGGTACSVGMHTPSTLSPITQWISPHDSTTYNATVAMGYYNGSSFIVLKTITTSFALSTDYQEGFVIDGNTLWYYINGLTGRVDFPPGTLILSHYATMEFFCSSSTPTVVPYFKEFYAGTVPAGKSDLAALLNVDYHFDGTYVDSSGNAATLTPANSPTFVTGTLNSAINFVQASSQKATVSNSLDNQLAGRDWTIMAWYTPASLPSGNSKYQPIVGQWSSSTKVSYGIYVDQPTNLITCIVSPDGTGPSTNAKKATYSVAITAGTLYQIVCEFDTTTGIAHLVVNNVGGTDAVAIASLYNNTTDALEIGSSGWLNAIAAGSFANGTVDELCIFSSPPGHGGYLTALQIAWYYNNGLGRPCVPGNSSGYIVGAQTNVASPTAPASTAAFKMQGLAATFIAGINGVEELTVSGTVTSATVTSGDGIKYQISYGTGAAPSNAGALAGTQVGTIQSYKNPTTVTAANVAVPFSTTATVTGLTPGTTYWVDLAAESIATNSSGGLSAVSVSAIGN